MAVTPLPLSPSFTQSLCQLFVRALLSPVIDVDVLLGEPIQAETSAHTGLELAYDSLTTLSPGKFAPRQGLSASRLSVPVMTPIPSLFVLE